MLTVLFLHTVEHRSNAPAYIENRVTSQNTVGPTIFPFISLLEEPASNDLQYNEKSHSNEKMMTIYN